MTALALENVSHRFGQLVAVDAVALEVGQDDIVCVLGPSGCGKSTLLRIAAGLETLQQGRIRIGNRTVADAANGVNLPPDERNVGFVFQDFALFPHLTALDNVAFGLRGLSADERRERATKSLAQVGMTEFANAYPHTLSGGQQQRVALARAMCPRPRLLLLDEPFSGLDARHRHRVADETWRLLKKTGTATVVVTHDPEEAMFLSDNIAVMRSGRIEQFGPPADVYARPRNSFVMSFLSDVNRLSGKVNSRNKVETPFGPVEAEGFSPGDRVEVLIRQEGLAVEPHGSARAIRKGGTVCKVLSDRSLGSASLIHLQAPTAGRGKVTVYSRRAGNAFFAPGEAVSVTLNPAHAFVFAPRKPK